MAKRKLWGGRFTEGSEQTADMTNLNSSLPIDNRLFKEDIQGSIQYAQSLLQAGLLTTEEHAKMIEGLTMVLAEWETDGWVHNSDADVLEEDVHSVNERRLGEIVGTDISGKLHTGRSRNDQVVTDVRLWLKSALVDVSSLLRNLLSSICDVAARDLDLIMPGYTHLQRAQPIRWSHFLMSHAVSLFYSLKRFQTLLMDPECELNACPLGSGALAGNPFGIDRTALANNLGFTRPSYNSMNSVSSRDYILDFLYSLNMVGLNLSRFAEDLIIYVSAEFGMVELSDAYSTGSSLMPQKKNPDSLELIRGKSGLLFGLMTGFMMTYKGLPSTYNKDLQDDKKSMFEAFDTIRLVLKVTQGVVSTMRPNAKNMMSNLSEDMLSTDLADEMVRNGLPFREAHHKSGELVALAEKKTKISGRKVNLSELTLEEFRNVYAGFGPEVATKEWWSFEASVERRSCVGGTSKKRVAEQIEEIRNNLSKE